MRIRDPLSLAAAAWQSISALRGAREESAALSDVAALTTWCRVLRRSGARARWRSASDSCRRVLARLATSGPGPSLLVPAASTRIAMSSSSSMRSNNSFTLSPSRITRSGIDAGDAGCARRVAIEHGVRLLVRLRPHDVADAEPLLVAVVHLDHAQHDHGRADAQRAAAREIDRAVAFRRVVDDDQEFRRVSGLVAAALLAHRLPRLPPDIDRDRRRNAIMYDAWRPTVGPSGQGGSASAEPTSALGQAAIRRRPTASRLGND